MTELQLTPQQLTSSAFLSKLFAIPELQLFHLAPASVCTNLTADQLGGMACSMGDVVQPEAAADWQVATMIVNAQALTLEKLLAVQDGLKPWLQIGRFSQTHQIGQESLAVTMQVKVCPQGLPPGTLQALAVAQQLELNLLRAQPRLDVPGLLVMDMDSTVIQMECIDEIAQLAGVGPAVSEVTELAMQGKLDFAQSLTQRVGCLKGADEQILRQVRDCLPLMPGLERLVRELKAHGWKIAIASGGFTYFADYLKERLGLDAAVSNQLGIEEGKLTGLVEGDIVDAKVKAQTLKGLAEQYGIAPEQTVAMGDGANDLVMMAAAGLGVAYKAKPVVLERADAAIRFGGLDELLHLLK
ncbi:phosphoserine phosphatase SerB [Bowmanella yangjiangensis]|uniref:Phosphoserine phosphatase n=1 Tax=Bowmanella yangjiangensis TaxID=2811230 RepID=A0ABS3CRX1_9ALTE|nr:phosphoserine phosphatase SerB [Bowmanella yangjiangensis]